MANTLYIAAKNAFLTGQMDWTSDTIKVSLVRGYTLNQGHTMLADITSSGGTIVATSAALSSTTATGGVADADDTTFELVPAGPACDTLIIFKDTGDPSTSPLIAYIDSGGNLPITPNGGDITVTWDDGAAKIFSL